MSDSCLPLQCSFLCKKHSRARHPLWSPHLFPFRAYHLPTMGVLVDTLGTIPIFFNCIRINSCQKIDKTRHSVSITHWSYWGSVWMCWLHNPISCLCLPLLRQVPRLLLLQPLWCLKRSCASWLMHLLKSLVKYKFINDAMRRFSPSLTEFYKFQQDIKYA